jgi:o-succinylbenzoate synthase
MKIRSIRTVRFSAPLKRPFVTALRHVERLEDIVVVIECDDGTVGYGEGAPTPQITGETLDSIEAAVAFLSPRLIERDIPDSFDALLRIIHESIKHNTTAKAALEIALYDLKAQAMKLPLYRMLGGKQKRFETDITISLNPIEQMLSDVQQALSLGYRILKIKIGESPQKDAERIRAIYQVLPEDITLRLDANQGWSARQTVTLLQSLEHDGIIAEFIEQPVAAEDHEGLRYIRERVHTPLLADESVFGYTDARALLDSEAVDYINIKLAKAGGISRALRIADLCAAYDTPCMIGCMLEGPISVAAGVHLASGRAETITMIDLDAVALLDSHTMQSEILFNENEICLSETSGLGVSL